MFFAIGVMTFIGCYLDKDSSFGIHACVDPFYMDRDIFHFMFWMMKTFSFPHRESNPGRLRERQES